MNNNKLINILKLNAQEIELGFQRASLEGKGTPQEVSDRREKIVQDFFRTYFPFPFRIAKGNIIDSHGGNSNSIDCIILNPSHPYTVKDNDILASIIFADAVDYAIEVKPALDSQSEIERSLVQIQSVKKLRRLDNSQIHCTVFANTTYKNKEKLIEHISNYYLSNKVPLNEQFDLLVVNNNYMLLNIYPGSFYGIHDSTTYGIYYMESKELTLASMLLHMSNVRISEMRMRSNFIRDYLIEIHNNMIMYCICPHNP